MIRTFFSIVKILLILFVIISFSSCAAEESISPHGYYTLLTKSKDFMAFCLYIANEQNPYWGQVISRLYYSYFTLARLVHIAKTCLYEQEKHTVIWQQNKKEVRKQFGIELKHLRTYYDYDYHSSIESKDTLRNNLMFILNNRKAFNDLIKDVKEQIPKYYKHEKNKDEWINKCNKELESIIEIQADLEKIVQKAIDKRE